MNRIVGKKNLPHLFLIAFVFATIAGCGSNADEDSESDPVDSSGAPSGAVDQSTGKVPEAPEHILSLFKDNDSLDPAALDTGNVQCLGLGAADTFSEAVEPWPARLKGFLASELEKFPEYNLVEGAVAGIYLAKAEFLSHPSLPAGGAVGGIMCDVADGSKGYVFLNYELAVTARQTKGLLEEYQPLQSVIDPHVLSEHGDQTMYSLIHEIFHAIDLSYYSEGGTPENISGRKAVHDLAWEDVVTSIYDRAEIFALTSQDPHFCPSRMFHLAAPQTPSEHAEAYRQIAEETNFISPYSQANAFEDFADTLSSWYFQEIYDTALVRTVYQQDLTTTPLSSAEELYKFDSEALMRDSDLHRAKMCAMVNLVFDEQGCQ